MALDDGVSALIGRIYDAAHDEERWEQLLYEVRARLGARCVLQSVSDFRHKDMQRSLVIGDPRRLDGVDEYREHAYALDPSFRWAIRHPNARFCDTEAIIPTNDYLDHEWIRWNRDEWIGSTHWLVGYTSPEDELTFGLSVHPWAHDGPLTENKKTLFRLLFDHMERAIRLASRPPIFADPDEPVVLIDRSGHVCAASAGASRIIASGDGLLIVDGELRASDQVAQRSLRAALRSALNADDRGDCGSGVAVPRPSAKRDHLLSIRPLPKPPLPFEIFGLAAVVRIVTQDWEPTTEAVLAWRNLFALTPAEVRFARQLLSGSHNVRTTANELGITYATARVHLRSLLDKTQTHSQNQLILLLSRLQ